MFGTIKNPFCEYGVGSLCSAGDQGQGLSILLNNLTKTFIIGASLFAFLNIVVAGYLFLNAGGEAKQVARAWDKIWQSLIGLLIVAGSFILAMIFGFLLFGDPTALIKIRVFTP